MFAAKLIPWTDDGLAEWTRRYLLHRGIDAGADGPLHLPEAWRALMRRDGLDGLERDFARLSADQALHIARRYGALWIITPVRYEHPALELTRVERDRRDRRPPPVLYLYRVRPALTQH